MQSATSPGHGGIGCRAHREATVFLNRTGLTMGTRLIVLISGLVATVVAAQIRVFIFGIAKIGDQTGAERCHARVEIRPDILT